MLSKLNLNDLEDECQSLLIEGEAHLIDMFSPEKFEPSPKKRARVFPCVNTTASMMSFLGVKERCRLKTVSRHFNKSVEDSVVYYSTSTSPRTISDKRHLMMKFTQFSQKLLNEFNHQALISETRNQIKNLDVKIELHHKRYCLLFRPYRGLADTLLFSTSPGWAIMGFLYVMDAISKTASDHEMYLELAHSATAMQLVMTGFGLLQVFAGFKAQNMEETLLKYQQKLMALLAETDDMNEDSDLLQALETELRRP